MIYANNISKSIGSKKILHKISLQLNPGEVTVIIGPSGCGKTTLLRCLSFLDQPNSGSLTFRNYTYHFPNAQINYKGLYPHIGIVFQQLFLWPHLTNRGNIELVLKENDVTNDETNTIIDFLSSSLSLTTFLDKYPSQSSVGQQQRVAIARTIALGPEVILLDEITSALDIVQINNLISIIKQLMAKESLAMLVVTHNLDVVKKIADRVIYMEDGSFLEEGGVEILENPKTKALGSFLGHSDQKQHHKK